MSHSELKIPKQAKFIQSDYESPINRSRLLGWADETLSKLKSDRNFLRRRVKKTKHEEENASDDSNMTSSKKDGCVGEEISQLKSNEVATYVSEIVTSKMKRKIKHMAFDASITREKQKSKASDKEHVTNTEADENYDKHYKLKSKRKLNISCNEDQEGDLCRHEICMRNRKKRKYNEDKSQEYSADNAYTESLLLDLKEGSRKNNKLMEHYRSQGVSCCHFCKCASKESQKLKKCEMPEDFYSVNVNDSASEKVKNAATSKQCKMKKLKHTLSSILEKGDRLSDGDVPREDLRKKKKEKRYCTHSVSEDCISEKKKLKKYKLYTQKYKADESMSASESESKMNDREKEAYEGCFGLGEKSERKENKHDHTFNEKWEETKKRSRWHSSCKTECASSRSQQNNDKENSTNTTEYKRKRKSEKDYAYSESEIISEEAKEHIEYGYYDDGDSRPRKKKKRKKEKENCEVYENVADFEERGKKKIYCDRSGINAMEASSIREKQKKKHKEAEKDKYYNLSVYIEGKSKKNRKNKTHKENANTDDNLKTDRNNVNALEASSTQLKQKKKHREVEKEICCNLSVDTEKGSKKKGKKKRHEENTGTEDNLNAEKNGVNAVEASSVQEKQKKKHKEVEKEKHCSVSVDLEEESKKNRKKERHKESAGTEDNLKRDRNEVNGMVVYSTQVKQKKKHREIEKENCYNLSVDIEEGSKKKRKKKRHEENAGTEDNIKTDRNDVNAMEASSVQEKQKKKHKEVEKEKHCSVSVDMEEESEKKRHEENVSTDDGLKTDEFVEDHSLFDGASSNTKYSIKRKDNSSNTSQRQTEGIESLKSKRTKAVSVVSKEKTWNEIKGRAIIGDIQYQKSNQCPESIQSVSNCKENKSNCMQINASHDRNIKQGRKTSNFGLSPIFRLLATEPDFSNAIHACQTCCRCKPHSDVTLSESAGSVTENISNVVIKIEPGVTIKQEKEDVDNSDPHIMDQQVLAVKKESQTELDTDYMNRTDAVRNMESNDITIDNVTDKEEEVSTGNSIVPNEYSAVKEGMEINKTDNEHGIEEYVEGFSNECVVNGNKETDIDIPFHNIYDDKISVKEEIFHLTNTCYYQNDSRNYAEDTSGVNIDFVGKQTTACMGNISELTSVGVLGSTYGTVTNVHRTTSVQEVNGLNLDAVPKYEPTSLNEPENRFILDVIPKAANVQNTTWNEEQANSLYWSSINRNEQQTSHVYDIRTFRAGRINFRNVPTWWKRGRVAKVLGVPVKAVRIYSNQYGPNCHKKYVSVNFPDPQCLQKIVSCAYRIPCSGWFVTRGSERLARVQQRSSESFHQ